MPPLSDQPLTLGALAEFLPRFHREVILPDIQRVAAESERRLVDQIERLWDALLDTRERRETEYLLLKSGIARVEERLERVDDRLSRIEVRLDPPRPR